VCIHDFNGIFFLFVFQLDREDPDLHDFLERSEVGTIFALPWLITW